jgi:hypothetical protein
MRPVFCTLALVCAVASHSYARPVLWYALEKGGTQNDIGTAPQANATISGAAAPIVNSPNSFSCASMDMTPSGAANNYVGTTADVQKIDALSEMTVTLWFNLQSAPLNNDCLVSDCPSGFPPAGQGGWELYIVNPFGGALSRPAVSACRSEICARTAARIILSLLLRR